MFKELKQSVDTLQELADRRAIQLNYHHRTEENNQIDFRDTFVDVVAKFAKEAAEILENFKNYKENIE